MVLGSESLNKLKNARVAVFGLGGVGGYVVEALVRSGVGALDLIDNDVVSLSNLNRQILALHSTLGQRKTDVCAWRALDINPEVQLHTWPVFVTRENVRDFPLDEYDYIVDAIDTVSAKLALIELALEKGVPILCSMGKELRRRGIEHVKVLCSSELPVLREAGDETKGRENRPVPGSTAFVPSVAGLLIASQVVRELTEKE